MAAGNGQDGGGPGSAMTPRSPPAVRTGPRGKGGFFGGKGAVGGTPPLPPCWVIRSPHSRPRLLRTLRRAACLTPRRAAFVLSGDAGAVKVPEAVPTATSTPAPEKPGTRPFGGALLLVLGLLILTGVRMRHPTSG
jgi:hypothetical protein